MKNAVKEFFKRGLMACAGGPVIMAIIYGILGATGAVSTITPEKVCFEILTITAMAFIAAGITVVYIVEKLPLFWAILLHAIVLYVDYLGVYLLNNWMPRRASTIGIFTAIYVAGFAMIWLCIYLCTRKKTKQLNEKINRERV